MKEKAAQFALLGCLFLVQSAKADIFPSPHLSGAPQVNSWKALRDFRIVKQELDFSCGAASLATILNEFYGQSVTEKQVLDAMGVTDRSTFEDLRQVTARFGLKAGGETITFDDLKRLTIPAIAYVQYRGQDHFTVIRGIRADGVVHVADPSWGNRQLTAHQFRQMWELTEEAGIAKGKILLVVPKRFI